MASESKKRKCKNTAYDRGGEKGKIHYLRRYAMYHKKNRVAANKEAVIDEEDIIKDEPDTEHTDMQPVRHGKWIHVESYRDCEGDFYSKYKCSCCDFILGGVYESSDLTNFCGGCGADMRGEK